jgi:hypothetical protein
MVLPNTAAKKKGGRTELAEKMRLHEEYSLCICWVQPLSVKKGRGPPCRHCTCHAPGMRPGAFLVNNTKIIWYICLCLQEGKLRLKMTY